jgi:hypothetical protein
MRTSGTLKLLLKRHAGLAVCLAALFLAGQAQAQVDQARADTAAAASADMRQQLQALLPQSRLVGQGRLTYWGLQVYDARLLAAPGFNAALLATQPFALELAYLRDFSSRDIAERSIAEMRRAGSFSEAKARAWVADMLRVLPSVRKGDQLTGLHRPGVGASFFVNGQASGEILDAEFAQLFFGIWLSPKTSEPQLRSALLAGAP